MTKEIFIEKIAKYVCKYAPDYDILCPSAVIAQAILESGWGESALASRYHNYFGLKCGTLWNGKNVNMETHEEYRPGTLSTITDNFRVYGSMEDGVKGYFEFIQLPRYNNLKLVKDPYEYLKLIAEDGFATNSNYAQSCISLVDGFDLRTYDPKEGQAENNLPQVTAEDAISVIRGWIGRNSQDGSHQAIIDIYNAHRPLARGYALNYSDSWCDATISAVFISLSAVDLIGGTECGVEEHIKLFKAAGIWIEDGSITPVPGDIITYNWDQDYQPNDGFADHIGIVEKVSTSGEITAIEGNRSNAVRRVYLPVGDGNIRGYARPKYSVSGSVAENTNPEPEKVQDELKKSVSWYGFAKETSKVRTWAGAEYEQIKTVPVLYRNDPVGVCSRIFDSQGNPWYYARLDGNIYGFVRQGVIERLK